MPGNYDDSVRHAAEEARRNGWTVVSDTTYEGYRDIPVDVMHGYGVMAREIVRAMADEPPTHVVVQAGVGALAASVCAGVLARLGGASPGGRHRRADAGRLPLPERRSPAGRLPSPATSTR